jgi:hypothetical protein
MATEEPGFFRTHDGLTLASTLTRPEESRSDVAAVLVHGGGVTRHEGGFFDRLAAGLADAGVPSLRFDLRGHGESEGRQEDLTIATILNDIDTAVSHVREETLEERIALIGASFTGGACALYSARRPRNIDRLVLLNPQLDYKQRTITSRDYWEDDQLDHDMASKLARQGFIQFTPTLRHGYGLLNEVFWVDVLAELPRVAAPTLIVHGTKDTFVPIEGSRDAAKRFTVECRLLEIEGSQHGFAVHDDPQYLNPRSQAWQAHVIGAVSDWMKWPPEQ